MGLWEEFRDELPLCRETAYFFVGAQAPLARPVYTAVLETLDRWNGDGWRIAERQWDALDEARAALGRLADCLPEQIVPCEGTSGAMNLAALSVLERWRRSGGGRGNVVLQADAHAAATYPWHNAVRLGEPLELRWPAAGTIEQQLTRVLDAIDDETIAVVVSHVSHRTGLRFPVEELAAAAPGRPWALIVDAAQSAGCIELAGTAAAADFLAFPAYKWLLGPPGIGFLVLAQTWLERPGPITLGWASSADRRPQDGRQFRLANPENAFLLGTPSQLALAGAAAGLRLLTRIGVELVIRRIAELTEHLLTRLSDEGHAVRTPIAAADHGAIISLAVADPRSLADELRHEQIEVGAVDDHLRIDLHAYNSEDDLERLLNALERLRKPPHRSAAPGIWP